MQKYSEDELKKMIPVFHLKPKTNTRTQCTLTMYAHNEERINDTELDVNTPQELKEKIGENTLLLGLMNNYFIIGKFCACNIPGSYLLSNSKLPVYYLSVIYNRQFLTGCLFNIFFNFNVDEETKSRLDEPRKYFKAYLDGYYSIKFAPVDEDFLEQLKSHIQENLMLKYCDEFDDNDEEKQEKTMEKIMDETDDEIKNYEKFFEERKYESDKFPTQKQVLQNLNSLCDTDIFKKIMSYGLTIREKQRIKEKCPDISYEKPTNIINLKEIKENPNKLDEIMKNRKSQCV
jgi:hypothetical protein